MPTSLYSWILGLGAIQGIVMGVLLLLDKGPFQQANRILAILLFFFSYRLLVEGFTQLDLITGYTHWTYHVLLEYNWIYGPLLFLYIRAYLYPEKALIQTDLAHFIPVSLEFIFSNWVKTQNFFWDGNPENLPWLGSESYVLWVQTPFQIWVAAALLIFYASKGKSLIHATRQNPQFIPNSKAITRVSGILTSYLYFAAAVILLTSVDYFGFQYAFFPFYDIPMYSLLAILTYALGLVGYTNRDVPLGKFLPSSTPTEKEATHSLVRALQDHMEEKKPFLDPEFSLEDLAQSLEVKAYQIRNVLNTHLQQKLPDFVNSYRVQEVIRMMQDPAFAHFSLLGLAEEAGFNSKATFNRAFKKHRGVSPGTFRDQLKAGGENT